MKLFKMKDLGDVKEFLGIEIIRNRVSRTLRLTQSSYISKILESFQTSDSNLTATPMMQSSKPTGILAIPRSFLVMCHIAPP